MIRRSRDHQVDDVVKNNKKLISSFTLIFNISGTSTKHTETKMPMDSRTQLYTTAKEFQNRFVIDEKVVEYTIQKHTTHTQPNIEPPSFFEAG